MSSVDADAGLGLDLEEWSHETDSKQTDETVPTNVTNESTTATATKVNELSIETALLLPLKQLYFTPSELSTLASNNCGIHSDSALQFPLRIASERIKGIAFQLWPAAKIFANFMIRMQTDQSVATPLPIPQYHKQTTAIAPSSTNQPDTSSSTTTTSAISSPILSSTPTVASIPNWWSGKRVVELGAGCGLNGMLAAALGAQVTLTDMTSVVPHLQANIELNFGPQVDQPEFAHIRQLLHSRCTAAGLDWGASLPEQFHPNEIDVILLSDCVYWEDLFPPLVRTLHALATPTTRIFLCQTPRRPKIEKRFYKLVEKHFTCQLIQQVAALEDSGEKKDVKLFELKLK